MHPRIPVAVRQVVVFESFPASLDSSSTDGLGTSRPLGMIVQRGAHLQPMVSISPATPPAVSRLTVKAEGMFLLLFLRAQFLDNSPEIPPPQFPVDMDRAALALSAFSASLKAAPAGLRFHIHGGAGEESKPEVRAS